MYRDRFWYHAHCWQEGEHQLANATRLATACKVQSHLGFRETSPDVTKIGREPFNDTVFLALDVVLVGSKYPCFLSPKTHRNCSILGGPISGESFWRSMR